MSKHTVDPPEDIQDIDDLTGFLEELTTAHNELAEEVASNQSNFDAFGKRLGTINDAVDSLQDDVERVNGTVETVEATMPNQQQEKLDRICGILEYAFDKSNTGPSGVKVTSNEAKAASNASKQTALRLIDEIAANFDWAESENPGGPKPKVLRVQTKGQAVEAVKAEARSHYVEQ